jgi:oligopeptide/dipeptide ABC transporter ATP-binding protein
VLELSGVHVDIGPAHILRGVSISVEAGQTLGVVGESGCGKSMTGLTVMGMLPRGAAMRGSLKIDGREASGFTRKDWLDVRGQTVAMVMQDPFTSLNPVMRIGDQIAEVYRLHFGMGKQEAWAKAVEMLEKVGVPSPEASARKYPHQMSGGQRQRVVIAIAFAARPKILIADEPTTALDVTLQAQVLRLIREMQEAEGTAVVLISHDIGVIGSVADRVAVFYAGRVVESGTAEQVLTKPSHPYTQALLAAMPQPGKERLTAIGGQPPRLDQLPQGCSFRPRCPHAFDRCVEQPPDFVVEQGHVSECWLCAAKAVQPSAER